ncbi:hypothetical protein PMAYCL1PPCAC_21366, partial [Pristionchus mayeri]
TGDDSSGVNLVQQHTACGLWNVKLRHGQVYINSFCMRDKCLRPNQDGTVDLSGLVNGASWIPETDEGISWYFKSLFGGYLSPQSANFSTLRSTEI